MATVINELATNADGKTFTANTTTAKGVAVKAHTTLGEVVIATVKASEIPIGITLESAAAGDAIRVAQEGEEAEARLGGTVTYGAQLTFDGNGRLIAAGSGEIVVAHARAAGDSGDYIPVIVIVGQFAS
jgi:hypothetical protein